jgi:hypothetical protein
MGLIPSQEVLTNVVSNLFFLRRRRDSLLLVTKIEHGSLFCPKGGIQGLAMVSFDKELEDEAVGKTNSNC